MMMDHSEKPKNANQSMVMNRPYIAPFFTSFAPRDSPEFQLSVGAKLVKNIKSIYANVLILRFFISL